MIDKDRSIITQVAAKIAADLTETSGMNVDEKVGQFASLFVEIKDILLDSIYGDQPYAQTTTSTNSSGEAAIKAHFPEATQVISSLSVKNDQQGPLPQWLLDACARDGVTEVYDNRADLSTNPRRPWFKAVNDKEKAYWPPKGA